MEIFAGLSVASLFVFVGFMVKKSGLIFKSPVATASRTRRLGSLIMSGQQRVHAIVLHMQCHFYPC